MPDLDSTVAFPSQNSTPNVENAIDDANDLQILDPNYKSVHFFQKMERRCEIYQINLPMPPSMLCKRLYLCDICYCHGF